MLKISAFSRHTVPIGLLGDHGEPSGPSIRSGTGILLALSGGHFLVTNEHVVRPFLIGDDVTLHAGQFTTFRSPPSPPIRWQKRPDLATIPIELDDLRGKEWFRPTTWPPARAVEGESILCVGYPGDFRRELDRDHNNLTIDVVTPIFAAQAFVRSVGELDFSFVIQIHRMKKVEGYSEVSALTSYGGMSGGPVFALRDETALIGIITEAPSPNAEPCLWRAMHAEHIAEDGSITRFSF